MRNPILNFFLLVLKILLNLCLDAYHKYNRFSKTLTKKDFKFVSSKKNSIFMFYTNFLLLPAKIDLILEKQIYKEITLVAFNIGCVKIIFTLLTKIIALYI